MATEGLRRAKLVGVFCLCLCAVSVVCQVELGKGEKLLNNRDPVQYADCHGLHRAGYNISGPHVLYLNKTSPCLVRCEFTGGVGYTVIQRRVDGRVNFMETLDTYMKGFGSAQHNYWAGLDLISHLTVVGHNKVLTINMQDYRGTNRNARYTYFQVQPLSAHYQMTVSGFSGAGLLDDMVHSSGMYFHTYDVPDANRCALQMKAGWWYNYCAYTLPNGYFYPPGPYTPSGQYYDGIFWESFGGFGNSLKFISMSVSPS